jgi:hypothetical protein
MMTRRTGTRIDPGRRVTGAVYVGAVIAAGCGLLVSLAPRELHQPAIASGLLAATLVLSLFKLRLPLGNGVSTMSMAYTVDFVALIVEGAGLAMLLGAIGVLIQCTLRVRRRQPIHRAAFSAAAVVIAVQVAGWVWNALGASVTDATIAATLLPLLVSASAYYGVNTSLVVGAIATTSSTSPARAWSPEFWWSLPAYLISASVAGLVALAILNGPIIMLPIVASPLYACYRMYRKRWTGVFRLDPGTAPVGAEA